MIITILTIALISVQVLFYSGYFLVGHFLGRKINYGVNCTNYLPNVSLVIATYNEKEVIKKKIANIREIDYPREKLEIIIVDSSTDGTREIVKNWIACSDFNIRLIEEENRKGLATALNIGYAAASGEIVIKNDVDITLEKQSIKELVKYFSNPEIGAVTGSLRVTSCSNLEVGWKSIYSKLRLWEANLDSTYIFEPFSAYKKELIVPIECSSVADDSELALKIRKNGHRTVYSPSAIAYDECPTALRTRLRQKSRRAQGHIRLVLQNFDVFLNSKYGKFGLVIFPANVFMVILSPWLFVALLPLFLLFLCELIGATFAVISLFSILLLTIAIYVSSTPKIVAGFLEAQLALLVGTIKLILKGPDFMWTKEKRM